MTLTIKKGGRIVVNVNWVTLIRSGGKSLNAETLNNCCYNILYFFFCLIIKCLWEKFPMNILFPGYVSIN